MPSNYFIFRLRAIFGMKRTTFFIRISQGNISNSCGLWHAKEVSQVHLRKNQLQLGARQVTSNYEVAPKRRSCRLSPTWVRTVNFKETHFQGKSKCDLFKNGLRIRNKWRKKFFAFWLRREEVGVFDPLHISKIGQCKTKLLRPAIIKRIY